MAGFAKKVLIGASLAAGLSVVAGAPAQALSITFHGDQHIQSYTHEDGNLWVGADAKYLTDGLDETNVELWVNGEIVGQNVGFTATEGSHTVKVESVTAADWDDFADDWLDGLFATYAPLDAAWQTLDSTMQEFALNLFKTYAGSGDPNIAEFKLDETGAVDIKMAGWYDLNTKIDPILRATKSILQLQAASGDSDAQAQLSNITFLEGVLDNIDGPLQISEIAKVTINGEVNYAYSFAAEKSGFVAKDDEMSYSGIYSWKSVPEPSTMLGLMAVGGLIAASKRKSNKNA